jgi:hypothetical protein
MNNIVCVTSPISVGCTFLDWSIHFLSGKNKFYSTRKLDWIPLSTNPVLKTNAHGHKKNHPSGHNRAWQCINQLTTISNTELLSFYPCVLHADLAGKELNIFDNLDTKKQRQIHQYQQDDYAKMINSVIDSGIKVVYVSTSKHNILYTTQTRSLERMYFLNKSATSSVENVDHIDQLFFADSIKHWEQNGLTNVWDHRERLALCTRPFDTSTLMEDLEINRTARYCHVDAQSLWYNGKNTIKKIMKFLNVTININVWDQWVDVYHNWQAMQLNILEFNINVDHIVNAIVNNWYYEIGNLTFEQEIVIQHCLIYQHGLNLKTWQLEKFPSNAQDLYKLLEPNIHPVLDIYSRLATQVC